MTTAAITGANGFIGLHVGDELVARGVEVRALVRSGGRADAPTVPTVEVDYNDAGSIRRAVHGVDAVVHLLGQAHDAAASADVYELVNVAYTRQVMAACVEAQVQRVVFMSSVKVLGNGQETPYVNTTHPCPEDAYGWSKLRAENVVRELATSAGIDYVILRPPVVYGAGVKGNLRHLIRYVQRGLPVPIPYPAPAARSLISARNLASAVVQTLDWPDAIAQSFLVADGNDVTVIELSKAIAAASGRSIHSISFPAFPMRAMATLCRRQAAVDRLLRSLRVDTLPFVDYFQWRPPQTLEAGIREAIEGYRVRT